MKSNDRIRLLVTVPQLSPTASPYREMIALARHLPKDEFALTICALRQKGMEEVVPELNKLGVNHMVAHYRPYSLRYSGRVISSLRDQSRINQYGPYDIQHSLDYAPMPSEAFLARANSRAYLFNFADGFIASAKPFWPLKKSLQWYLLRVKAGLSKRVIAVSDSISKLLQGHGIPEVKIRRVYLGIDLDDVDTKTKPVPTREKGLIVAVGRISPEKRYEDAIRAMAEIVKTVPEARLMIAGGCNDTSYIEGLKSLTGELGLNGSVEFTGVRKDVLQLLSRAECMIHCCDHEAFGWVILEAMAVACPVVACGSEGPTEILEHGKTGLLVKPKDIEGYAYSVLKILNSPDFAARLGADGRKAVESRFSSKAMVDGFRNIYQELVQ